MKIFISHAAVDVELAEALVTLLQLGAGVSHADIFFSSTPSSIPNGDFFVQRILGELNAAELIISILSPSYLKSDFCLAEVGAAQLKRIAGSAKFYSLYVPPVKPADLGGVLYGVQSALIVTSTLLGELRDVVTKDTPIFPGTPVWDKQVGVFIGAAKDFVAREIGRRLSSKITVQDVYPERATEPGITYKSKLRINLKNETGEDIQIGAGTWNAGDGDISTLTREPRFQVEGDAGWLSNDWGEERPSVLVPVGRAFRFWIGFPDSISDIEIRRHQVSRHLGVLRLSIDISGERVAREIRL